MTTITTEELKAFQEADVKIPVVDVLEPEQHQEGHIPNSENIPVSTPNFVDKIEAITDAKDSPVVVYCASRSCEASPKAAEQLEEAGFTKVYDYEGGIAAWQEAGEPLERG